MYAIVDIAGKQFKVTKDQFVYAPKMDGEEGASVEFDNVLLFGDGSTVEVGAPLIKGARVAGTILGHVKGDKIVVFKKKRRKGYKKKNGHRQDFTKIQIEEILSNGAKRSTSKKSEAPADKKSEAPADKTKTETAPRKAAKSKVAKDDLTEIKGIGPVFQKELNKLGYTTFAQIAKLSAKEIETISEAIDGVSTDLIESEKWILQARVAKGDKIDDLTEINGIGPVFSEELNKLGYTSFNQIAKLTVKEIENISDRIDGVSIDLIASEEWINQAKELKKK